ncbi:hypothetical protein GCM10008982_11190 [Anoxybacillus voinovskiensis]|nr:hypothetical protein GCM10008982_11190 [Anoxybacillus voinovskiensis]
MSKKIFLFTCYKFHLLIAFIKKSAKRPPIGEDRTSPTEEALAAAVWGGATRADGAWS